uniref:M protein repeat protein n=1 Tax=Kwoniella pini CBS 10737 TaxID=1296096 RepID=A0A1B9HYG7_9TREE|nr:uncharacterized protein I206_06197 [Kwoniella pini CBS 10737]OCF48329.1 hypothetical protein I206_06197 [Kwoniella pini CBS 10737]
MSALSDSQGSEAFSMKTMDGKPENQQTVEEFDNQPEYLADETAEELQDDRPPKGQNHQELGSSDNAEKPQLADQVDHQTNGKDKLNDEEANAQNPLSPVPVGERSNVQEDINGEKKEDQSVVEQVKEAASGVKKVLKSGVFGGSPKPSPKATPSTASTTTRHIATARQSLAPKPGVKPTSSVTRPTALSSTRTSTSATVGKPTHVSRPSQPSRPGLSDITRPTASSTAATTTRPRAATGASDRTTSSSAARPTRLTESSIAKPRPSVKPPVPTASSAARITRPTASSSSTAPSKPDPSKPSNTAPSAKLSSVTPSTINGIAKPRSTVGLASSTSRLSARPTVGRASIAPPSTRSGTGAVAQKGRAGSGPSAIAGNSLTPDRSKEISELKGKLEEVEKRSAADKEEYARKVDEWNKEKISLEQNHAAAISELRDQVDNATSQAGIEIDERISALRESHMAELEASEEQRKIDVKGLEARLDSLSTEKDQLNSQLTSLQSELISAQSSNAELNTNLTSIQEELSSLRTAHEESTASLNQLSDVKSSLEARVLELEKIKEKHEAELAEGAEEAERSLVGATGLEGQIKGLQDEIEELKRDAVKSRETVKDNEDQWIADKEALLKQLEGHKATAQEHSDALNRVNAEHAVVQEQLKNLQTTHEQLSSTHADLLETSAKHPQDLAELEAKLKDANEQHEVLLKEATLTSERKMSELEGKLAGVTLEKEKAEKDLDEVHGKLTQVEEELGQLAELRRNMEEKENSLNDIIAKLEEEKEKDKAEFEEKYKKAFDEAKAAANESHHAELTTIREDLASTRESLIKAHEVEIEALKSSHAISLSDLQADQLKSSQTLQDSLLSAQKQAVENEASLNELKEVNEHLRNEVTRLIGEIEQIGKSDNKGTADLESELKKVKGELQGVKDELDGAKEIAEMNKSHFEASLAAIQEQHTNDERVSAEQRVKEAQEDEGKYVREINELRENYKKIEIQLQDEKVEKNNLLTKLTDTVKTPPTSPRPHAEPYSPALTKHHEAHNAKVVDLENEIRRLQQELSEAKRVTEHTSSEDAIDETETF